MPFGHWSNPPRAEAAGQRFGRGRDHSEKAEMRRSKPSRPVSPTLTQFPVLAPASWAWGMVPPVLHGYLSPGRAQLSKRPHREAFPGHPLWQPLKHPQLHHPLPFCPLSPRNDLIHSLIDYYLPSPHPCSPPTHSPFPCCSHWASNSAWLMGVLENAQ